MQSQLFFVLFCSRHTRKIITHKLRLEPPQVCVQETLSATSFHGSLGYCCFSEGSLGTLSTVALSNPSSWKNSAPWALGCWLHPFCGPLKSPARISSPSRGKILPSTFGLSDGACFRILELEGTSRASGPPPGTWVNVLSPEISPKTGQLLSACLWRRHPCCLSCPSLEGSPFPRGEGGAGG